MSTGKFIGLILAGTVLTIAHGCLIAVAIFVAHSDECMSAVDNDIRANKEPKEEFRGKTIEPICRKIGF